jgi:hypothetical protein
VVCGEQFATTDPRKRTCSTRCYLYHRRHPGVADQPKLCPSCGVLVSNEHRASRYCSRACASAASKRRNRPIGSEYKKATECIHCKASLRGRKAGAKYCSDFCWRRETSQPGSCEYLTSRRCEHCGIDLPASFRVNKRHCSDRCTVLANQVIRRARRCGLPVERFSRWDIFERDGWTCHICKGAVDPTVRNRQPASASLDHLIPLSHRYSPGHVRANVALAHLRCNLSKNGRVRTEDWELHRTLGSHYKQLESA